ncbi:MAG: hypothetical protein HY288_13680 [Planctomycetia bacterium]|nr:hypothetical protein [Planctomycetia bacterium]
MATHSNPAPSHSASDRTPADVNAPNRKLVEYEQFIEAQLRKTRSHVRSVDIAGSLMTLAAGTMAFFFLAAMIDHWVVRGGLGFWERLLLFAGYVVAAVYYLVTRLLPLFLRRINPVYAAHTIERSRPSLKNALVNFLLFRANPAGLTKVVYQAIEEQAATNLAKVHVEAAVDRSKLIRIGYALVGIMLVCALYIFLSPKDLLKTVSRVAMPWAEIGAPTRTSIAEIEPGNAPAFRGQQVTVWARIKGLPSGGKVTLFYTTADGQIVDRPVEMILPIDGRKYTCVLPAADTALQQSLEYRITAGDAASKSFKIEVVAAPTIVVRSVEYKYPSYTGLLAQRVEHQGDIKAIEGTEVTLDALANQDIESASIDFDCDGKPDVRMQADKQQAKATFRLRLKDDQKTPEHGCYQLLFKNDKSQQNPQPVRHQIEVTRDLPPEIQFVGPKKDEIDLPLSAAVNLEIVANDPDFSLRLVKLSASVGKQPLVDRVLLNEARRGQFVHKFRFEPRKLGLKAGDVVEYSAMAEDNKDPRPNRTETAQRRIRIVSPSQQPPRQDQLAKNDEHGDAEQAAADDKPAGDDEHPSYNAAKTDRKSEKPDPQAKPQDGAGAERGDQEPSKENPADQQQGQSEEQGEKPAGETAQQRPGEKADPARQQREADPSVPNDGSDDGDAVERILKHRDEQNKSKQKPDDPRQQRSGEQQKSADPKSGDQEKPGTQAGGDGKQNDSQATSQEQNTRKGDQQKGDRSSGENAQDPNSAEQDKPNQADRQQTPIPERQGDDGQDAAKSQSSRQQNSDKPHGSKGQQGQKGSGDNGSGDKGSGDKGQGDDSPGGQQGQKGQPGQNSNAAGQGGQSDESHDAAGQDTGERRGQGSKGKPTDPKPGDEQIPAERDQQGEGPQQGKGTKRDKADGDHQNPQAGDRGDGQTGEPSGSRAKPTSKDPAGTQRADGQDGEGEPADKSDGKNAGKKAERADQGQAKRDHRTTDQSDNATPDKSDPAGDAKQGQGAGSKGDSGQESNKKSSRDKPNPDAKGGDGENEKGESGKGQAGQDTKGSPTPMEQNQPRKKSREPTGDEKDAKQDDAPQSPSISKKESDSQGIDDGDRAGGGKRGGGQKANKSGTGGAGQNTAADEGAGRSDEAGKGETSGRAGSDRQADKPTGQSGSQHGPGSAGKPSTGDGAKPGEGDDSKADSPQPDGAKSGVPSGTGNPGEGGANHRGQPTGGKPDNNSPPDRPFQPSANEAEEANLDYARTSTDLALEYLKDQLRKDHPDPELLKQLGWTQKDLQNFVRRWEQMRKQAQAPGEKGAASRQELDDALRSLGLRPRGSSLGGNAGRDDQSRGYKESRRTSPPPEYAPQYKAYQQGTSRAAK